jgi:hypothetical protein
MIAKSITMIKFIAFISLLNLLIGISIMLGATIGERKLIMYEHTVDPNGKTVASTPIYAYAPCQNCVCKDK